MQAQTVMVFSAYVFACLLPFFLLSCASSPRQIQAREPTGAYVITGVGSGRGNDGSVPFRQEIRTLQQDQDKWNLYLLGMSKMQSVEQTNKLSWYQIAGGSATLCQALSGSGTMSDVA